MAKIRFQLAPDVEFKRRLKAAFPEGIKIDKFEFGLNLGNDG